MWQRFAAVAQRCNALVPTVDVNGNSTTIPRYQCNLLLTGRRSAGDIVRGIRNGSAMYLSFDSNGLIQLNRGRYSGEPAADAAGQQQQHGSVERRMASL